MLVLLSAILKITSDKDISTWPFNLHTQCNPRLMSKAANVIRAEMKLNLPVMKSLLFSCPAYLSVPSTAETRHPRSWPWCAITMKMVPPGPGEGSSHLFVIIVRPSAAAQASGELGRLFVSCPPDVACPPRGCSFASLLPQYLIYSQYSPVQRSHRWTFEDMDRLNPNMACSSS